MAAALVGVLTASAVADVLAPKASRWPGDEIVVLDDSAWNGAVDEAITQWNVADVGIRFRHARDGERPDVTIVTDEARAARFCRHEKGTCAAFASRVGWQRGKDAEIVLPTAEGDTARHSPTPAQTRLVVHELGHVLGLHHRGAPCAVMNPDVGLEDCDALERSAAVCGPLRADVVEARRMYGGRGRFHPVCPDSGP